MDLLKDDPIVWKLWSVNTFKEFNTLMFKARKALADKGIRAMLVVDPSSVERDNPSGFAIFYPKNDAESAEMENLLLVDGTYCKILCGG